MIVTKFSIKNANENKARSNVLLLHRKLLPPCRTNASPMPAQHLTFKTKDCFVNILKYFYPLESLLADEA